MSVACSVVEAQDGCVVLSEPCHIGEGLVTAGGVFDQNHLKPDPIQVKGLHPSERRPDAGERSRRLLCGQAERPRCGYNGGGIVDVIDSRKGDAHIP